MNQGKYQKLADEYDRNDWKESFFEFATKYRRKKVCSKGRERANDNVTNKDVLPESNLCRRLIILRIMRARKVLWNDTTSSTLSFL